MVTRARLFGKKMALEGKIYNLGSEKENVESAKRRIKSQNYKGDFVVKVEKTPKNKNTLVTFKAYKKK